MAPEFSNAVVADESNQPIDIRRLMSIDRTQVSKGMSEYALMALAASQGATALSLLKADSHDAYACSIITVNDAFTKLTGYSKLEAQGETLSLLDPRPDARGRERLTAAFAEERPITLTVVSQKKDGSPYWVERTLSPVRDPNGALVAWTCAHSDTTASHLTQARRRMQTALLEEAHDAICTFDKEGHVTYWNKSAELLFGWKEEEMLDQPIQELVYASSRDFSLARNATRRDGHWSGQLPLRARDGRTLLVDIRWKLIAADGSDRPDLFLALHTDVTEKKRLEEQLLRSQRLESLGAVTSGVAHDLNNVLNPILISVGLLRDYASREEDMLDIVETISANAQRGADILRQVLTFARGASEERSVIRTDQLLIEQERLIRKTFPRSIRIHTERDTATWSISANTTQIEQVLMNLCVNARDAMMPQGGDLYLAVANVMLTPETSNLHHVARPGRYVVLRVKDTGTGIAPEALDNIFEPFYTTKRAGEGTGLGLATAHRIIEGLGGFIHVTSHPGRGAIFAVFLPALEPEPEIEPEPAKSPAQQGHGETILLVDDEKDILRLTSALLERRGFKVITAINGEEAIQLFEQYADDVRVLITDIMMPRVDGFETIKALRSMRPQLGVLATSGYASQAGLARLAQLSVNAFLPKPYSADNLLGLLHNILTAETRTPEDRTALPRSLPHRSVLNGMKQ